MGTDSLLSIAVEPDWEGMVAAILRRGTPARVHLIELFLDGEIKDAVCARFGLLPGVRQGEPFYLERREVAVQRFLGYDYVRAGVDGLAFPLHRAVAEDTAALARRTGRSYVDEHRGPITTWEEFERYPWPRVEDIRTRSLEWYSRHLPDGMCIIGSGGFAHFAEFLSWLMGYETLCYALFEQADLVEAIVQRLGELYAAVLDAMLTFPRVRVIWGSDDMGYRGGTLISPAHLRTYVLPGHRSLAAAAHAAGRPYLLHSCGNLREIMDDLIDDVGIDAKHSFEDTIEDVVTAKGLYGSRIAVLGGIDVDFLCRADEESVRQRVRTTLAACHPGGGYLLGSGNSVANYVPLGNYLAMLDEGRRFTA
ncbi:MAG: hypothetical protein JXR77_01315 [Lentisphaeria bacterium]|nr:hypothetical protein [Lentisphaeria bacterium]